MRRFERLARDLDNAAASADGLRPAGSVAVDPAVERRLRALEAKAAEPTTAPPTETEFRALGGLR